MGEVIFCKTRYQDVGYASYNDLWKLVEWAGYLIIYVDQIDPQSDNTYIVTPLNDEWLAGWKYPKATIIHYELEWRTDWRASVNEPPGVAEVWAIDKWYAEQIGARYVPVGSDERLNELGSQYPHEKIYDVAVMSYQTHRRQVITSQLENAGLRLAPVSGLWGRQRSDALLRSWCMTHTHQNDNMQGVASLRWALAAAHHLPMITETVNDRGIFGYTYMVQSDYEHLAAFTVNMLRDKARLRDYGEALHSLLCIENTFRKVIEAHV